MRDWLIPLALVAALPASRLPAQSNAERVLNDAYSRSHDYDLIHQRIELGAFDWDSTSFTGSVTTTVVARRPGFDAVILDAGHLLQVRRVTDARGAALSFAAHGDSLIVRLARPIAFGDTARFTIAYAGRVENGRGLTFIQPEGRAHRPRQIWSQGEDEDNHFWFPTYDFPNDKTTWDLVATVAAGDVVVSNGVLIGDRRNADGTHTVHWRQASPASTYLVSLIVAPLAKIHDTWRGVPVDYYVYHEDSVLARPLFRVTPDMIDVYSRLTGIPYPWAQYAQTTVADFFGGMENVSATTLVDWLPPDARAYRDRPWYQWILIPHELAHQWFGDYVTTENWANTWLNEGFAEFMPGAYWGDKLGPHAAQDYYLDEYEQFTRIDARRRMPLAALGSNNIYPKGALVLRMLEQHLGRERFWAGIHTYLRDHAHDNATTDDLRQAFLDATGENLDWFFDQWVYQAGFPQFTVAAAYDSTARRLTLSVKQTQVDSAPPAADSAAPRYTTPPAFRATLAMRIGTASGDVVRRIDLTAREQTVVLDSVAAPTMVVFDDDNAVVKSLTFDQPTAWLATQLRREPDLWNRHWVIGELARRGGDSLAARTLAWAATGADYFLPRAEAAEALPAVPAAIAAPALTAALRDTAAPVRVAAVRALGQVGGAQAVALARNAFEQDSSEVVRAAALGALVRADSAGRRAAIVRALAIPSYRDEIQDAALAAVAQTRDTGLFAAVEGLLGETSSPAFVFAGMANRGSTRAMDVLRRHLDDDRPQVRRWVLQAFRYSIRDSLALAQLRGVQDALRHDDTKRAVAALIAQLGGNGTGGP